MKNQASLADPEFRNNVVQHMNNIPEEMNSAMLNRAVIDASSLLQRETVDIKTITYILHRAFLVGIATGMSLKETQAD